MGRVANPRVVPRGPRCRQTLLGISWNTIVAFLGWRRTVLGARILAHSQTHGPGRANRCIPCAASSRLCTSCATAIWWLLQQQRLSLEGEEKSQPGPPPTSRPLGRCRQTWSSHDPRANFTLPRASLARCKVTLAKHVSTKLHSRQQRLQGFWNISVGAVRSCGSIMTEFFGRRPHSKSSGR